MQEIEQSEVAVPDISINNIDDVPADQIHIPLDLANNPSYEINSKDNSSNPISQLLGAYTTDYGNGHLELHANYILESGSIVDIIQVPLNISPDAAVEFYNSELYPDAEVTKGQINEFKAIYVNGENRKAIHLISDKYAYTILTVFNDIGIDYLEKVAKLIDKN